MGGKGQSLEEIEANLRKGQQQQQQQHVPPPPQPQICGLPSNSFNALNGPGKQHQQAVQAQMRQQNIANQQQQQQQNPFNDFVSCLLSFTIIFRSIPRTSLPMGFTLWATNLSTCLELRGQSVKKTSVTIAWSFKAAIVTSKQGELLINYENRFGGLPLSLYLDFGQWRKQTCRQRRQLCVVHLYLFAFLCCITEIRLMLDDSIAWTNVVR